MLHQCQGRYSKSRWWLIVHNLRTILPWLWKLAFLWQWLTQDLDLISAILVADKTCRLYSQSMEAYWPRLWQATTADVWLRITGYKTNATNCASAFLHKLMNSSITSKWHWFLSKIMSEAMNSGTICKCALHPGTLVWFPQGTISNGQKASGQHSRTSPAEA
jgi:hypothetical protein